MSWDDLFERTAGYDVTLAEVTAAVRRLRDGEVAGETVEGGEGERT